MVKIIVANTGEGKTKMLMDMANDAVKDVQGAIVYIDNDKKHIYDLHYDIRFVQTSDYPLKNYRELVGFIYGILSQNSDIEKIYIDGLYKIVDDIAREDLIKFCIKLQDISENCGIDFVIGAAIDKTDIPSEIKEMVINQDVL